MCNPPDPFFWAKTTQDGFPGCSVQEHSMAAAAVAKQLLQLLSPALLCKLALPDGIVTLVALHDIGKISPGFQTKCPQWAGPHGKTDEPTLYKWSKAEGRHALISQWFLERILRDRHTKVREHRAWATCLGAHHGSIAAPDPFQTYLPDDWMKFARNFLQHMEKELGVIPKESPKALWGKEIAPVMQEWVIGLIEVADWIASNEDFFPPTGGCPDLEAAAQRALTQIGFTTEPPIQKGKNWQELFPHAPKPRPIQQFLWEHPPSPGVYVIEDAMGGGKTEAALGLAYKLMEFGVADGLYFALPTQTTSNRIFLRVLDFLQRAGAQVSEKSVRLAHGHSWLVQEELFQGWQRQTGKDEGKGKVPIRNWFASARRSLLTRFGIGTIDQALMGEINVKHSFVRRFALAGKVVILDEVHSYDLYTGRLITQLVSHLRHLGATVIILSATLTKSRLAELLGKEGDFSAYPLATTLSEEGKEPRLTEQAFAVEEQKEIRLLCSSAPIEEIAEEAYRHAELGQCVLWIRNSVKDAQAAYNILLPTAREGGPEIGLLHARFPLWRRQELEHSWIDRLGRDGKQRPKGCVLVATQVAEQSLDIDADFLITDLAPTDMLLQRAGRLWRHKRLPELRHADRAEMLLLSPRLSESMSVKEIKNELGATGHVYAPYILLRTREVWQEKTVLTLPADIRPLLEQTYADREEGNEVFLSFSDELKRRNAEMESSVCMSMDKRVDPQDDTDDAATRYGSIETVEVLLLKTAPEPLSATRTLYSPLHGEPFVLETNQWSFSAARSIQENIVRVPAYLIDKQPQEGLISGYSLTNIIPLFPLDSNSSVLYSNRSGEPVIEWSPMRGVFPLARDLRRRPLTDSEDDNEEEFMY